MNAYTLWIVPSALQVIPGHTHGGSTKAAQPSCPVQGACRRMDSRLALKGVIPQIATNSASSPRDIAIACASTQQHPLPGYLCASPVQIAVNKSTYLCGDPELWCQRRLRRIECRSATVIGVAEVQKQRLNHVYLVVEPRCASAGTA